MKRYMSEQEMRTGFSLDQDNIKRFLQSLAKAHPEEKQLIDTPELKLWVLPGSVFDSTMPVIKGRYVFRGDIFAPDFLSLLNEKRTDWDTSIVDQEVIQQLSPDIAILHYAMEPPLPTMKPKDYVEKRIRFVDEDTYYGYCSNVPDEVYPQSERYKRASTIFAGSILRKEGNDNVYCSISQVNLNVCSGLREKDR